MDRDPEEVGDGPAATAAEAKEEYQVWKQNTPFLYDLLISHALEWPSLTVQWLPSTTTTTSSSSSSSTTLQHRLLLGTHTADDAPNFLMLADVLLPPVPPPAIPAIKISQSIRHDGEVNRARHMPQKPSLVATKTCGSEVLVFDCNSHPKNSPEMVSCPDITLKGHSNEGYGLSWNKMREGYLLSGSYDSKICLWDLSVAPEDKSLHAKTVFESHKEAVEDVDWHCKHADLFGSVGDDHMLMVWDLRLPADKPMFLAEAHENEVNSLSFNPFNEWILATASADTTVNLFDMRKLHTCLHTFSSHTAAALQVEWSPKYETILASSADDKRIMVWDLCRIGDEQTPEDADDAPPELLFSHGGHTAKISEFSWSPDEPWVIASVADDNILQVWQMAESIYRDDFGMQSDGDPEFYS